MADREQVFDAADELTRRGEKPTYRRVIALLPRGGSPNDICSLLRDWATERAETMVEATRPEILDRLHEDFVSQVWIEAKAAARREVASARSKFEDLDGRVIELETQADDRDAMIATLREQLAAQKRLFDSGWREAEARISDLSARLAAETAAREAAEAALRELREEVGQAEPRPAQGRAKVPQDELRDIWNRIFAACSEILRREARPLDADEIHALLPSPLKEEAVRVLGGFKVNKLRRQLTRKADRGETFARFDPQVAGPARRFVVRQREAKVGARS